MNIELKNVNKVYDINNDGYVVFKKINLKFTPGIYVISGNNSSGKTTFLKIISGLDNKYEGVLLYNDKVLSKKERSILVNNISFVSLKNDFDYDLNVRDNIIIPLLFEGEYNNDIADKENELLKIFGYESIADYSLNVLSNTQLIVVAFIRAIISKPKVLLIDEIFALVDFNIRSIMIEQLKLLRRNGCLIIITTNGTNNIDFADNYLFINNKNIEGNVK